MEKIYMHEPEFQEPEFQGLGQCKQAINDANYEFWMSTNSSSCPAGGMNIQNINTKHK